MAVYPIVDIVEVDGDAAELDPLVGLPNLGSVLFNPEVDQLVVLCAAIGVHPMIPEVEHNLNGLSLGKSK